MGSVTTVGEGVAPESDIAVLAILGYDPREEPPARGVVATAEPLEPEARRATELTNAFVEGSHRILDASEVNAKRRAAGKLPGNLVLTRDGGDHVPKLQPIKERFGPAWGCFVEMPVERGIALLLGMDEVPAPRLDGTDESFARWADLAAEALEGYDAVYVHIKGPDVPA